MPWLRMGTLVPSDFFASPPCKAQPDYLLRGDGTFRAGCSDLVLSAAYGALTIDVVFWTAN